VKIGIDADYRMVQAGKASRCDTADISEPEDCNPGAFT